MHVVRFVHIFQTSIASEQLANIWLLVDDFNNNNNNNNNIYLLQLGCHPVAWIGKNTNYTDVV
jgi:hypothetical protein